MLLDLSIPKGEKWSGDCRVNSIFMLLRYYGISGITKPHILALGNGINFTYSKLGYKQYSCFVSTDPDIEMRVLDALKIEYVKESVSGELEGILKLDRLIDHGTPILMKVNADALVHDHLLKKKLRDNNGERNSIGVTGTPLLYGYQGIPERAVLFWTNNFHRPEPVEMVWDKLNFYRNTEILPASPDNICFYLQKKPEPDSIAQSESIQKILDDNINDTVIRIVECRKNAVGSVIENLSEDSPLYGIEAVKALCSALTAYCDVYLNNRDKPIEIKYSVEYLANAAEFLEKGSDTAYREEMSEMLRLHSSTYVRMMGLALKRVANDWRTMIVNAKKLGKAEEPVLTLRSIKRAARNIERRESLIYTSIYRVLDLGNRGE